MVRDYRTKLEVTVVVAGLRFTCEKRVVFIKNALLTGFLSIAAAIQQITMAFFAYISLPKFMYSVHINILRWA